MWLGTIFHFDPRSLPCGYREASADIAGYRHPAKCGFSGAGVRVHKLAAKVRLVLALLLVLVAGSASGSASSFTYAYEGEDGTRFLWHREGLMQPDETLVAYLSWMEYCRAEADSCGLVMFSGTTTWGAFGDVDSVVIEGANTIMLPDGALSRIGAADTLPISWSNRGRFAVYRYEPGYEFEYYFKDSTGERTFRFAVEQMLLKDFVIPESALVGCVFSPGNACVGAQLDMNVAETDVVSFGNEGFDSAYFFPRYAFSTIGTHYTTGGLTSGVLTVNLVRKPRTGPTPDPGPGPDPDPVEDPEPVPEPSTWLLSAVGVAALLSRRICGKAPGRAETEISR